MINIYIDESGSMTTQFAEHYPYFVIAMVVARINEKAPEWGLFFIATDTNNNALYFIRMFPLVA